MASAAAMPELPGGSPALPSTKRLWFGFLAGVLAWKLQLMVNYALVPYACWQALVALIHVASVVTLALALGGAVVAWGSWRRLGEGVEMESGGIASRSRFLALSGVALGLFFALLILGQWLPNLLLGPCDGIS
jgi:hypothetical protein